MVIYLLHILLHVSSHQIKKMTSSLILLVSVLLQMGFTQPSMSPYQRWALTSPFHPYRKCGGYFLLHFPWSRLHWTLSSIIALWGPDFPRTLPFSLAIRDHLIYSFSIVPQFQVKINVLALFLKIIQLFY